MATRTSTQMFAMVIGIAYLLAGLAGLYPGLVRPPPVTAPELVVSAGYGYLLGLFPINLLHNIAHLLIGVWGVAAYQSATAARTFSQSIAIFYGVLAILGLFPWLQTAFGLIPLFGHDVWLHALTAVSAAYFGFQKPLQVGEARQASQAAGNGRASSDQPQAHP